MWAIYAASVVQPEIAAGCSLLRPVLNAYGRTSAFVVASGALHLLLTVCPEEQKLIRHSQDLGRADPVDFELLAIPAESESAERPAELAAQGIVEARSPARMQVAARGAVREQDFERPPADVSPPRDSAPATSSLQEESPREAEPAGTPAEQPMAARDLSPLAAARALTMESPSNGSVASAPKQDERAAREARARQEVDRAAEARLATSIPGLNRKGQDPDRFDHEAMDFIASLAKPWDFIVQPLRGARYQFHGLGFDAIIRADGSVQYQSKSGLQTMFGSATGLDGRPTPTFGVGFRDSPAEKLFGRDSAASERRRFLERTRALRELLHERALRVALARADAHLTRQLGLIARRLEAGNEGLARAQLFALWDECAEDEVGLPARRQIEAFAREHCAEGSALGFGAPELLAFNQKRSSRQRFDPYQQAVDAGLIRDASVEPRGPVLAQGLDGSFEDAPAP